MERSQDGRDMDRREFLTAGAVALGAMAVASTHALGGPNSPAAGAPPQVLIPMPELAYTAGALAPHISERTVHVHYNGHHKNYYRSLLSYLSVHEQLKDVSLDDIVRRTKGSILTEQSMFTVAVLLWNHNLYWQSMKPRGGVVPTKSSAFERAVQKAFGGFEGLKAAVLEKSRTIGIGWVWVCRKGDGVEVAWTDYQDSPFLDGRKPLLALDVWEHAYYLDYQNDRDSYVRAWLDHLVNWQFAESNFEI